MNALVPCGVLVVLLATACKPTVILESPEADPVVVGSADPLVEYEAVRESVRHYAAALSERDVAAATAWVVTDTFGYYEDLRIAALRSTREQLEGWDLMSVMLVLQIRVEITRAELEALDGRGLFERAVSEGLVGEQLEEIVLDDVWLDESGERAEVRLDGEPVVWLRKQAREGDGDGEGEQGRWRVDIPEMIRLLGPAIEAMAHEAVALDGKVRTALTFVELSTDAWVDIAVLDGPLD